METRANYTAVGAFVLISLISLAVFIIWLSKINFGESTTHYEIYFSGSVTGLKEGSAVQYRGVPIGSVKKILIDPEDMEKIKALVDVDSKVPIKEDAFATLESQGITGVSFVQINGGSRDRPNLQPEPGKKLAVIPSRSSLYEQVTASLPLLLSRANSLIEEIKATFSKENRDSLQGLLTNLKNLTTSFDPNNKEGLNLSGHVKDITQGLKSTLQKLDTVTHELQGILQDNRVGLKEFSSTGLTSLSKFLEEGREAMASLRRVGDSLERSPSRFLHHDPQQGVKIP